MGERILALFLTAAIFILQVRVWRQGDLTGADTALGSTVEAGHSFGNCRIFSGSNFLEFARSRKRINRMFSILSKTAPTLPDRQHNPGKEPQTRTFDFRLGKMDQVLFSVR